MQMNDNLSTLPDALKCPITHELFHDPVIGADGHTYERKNITAWIQKTAISPITREPMNLKSLRPNYVVKKMVDEFLSLSSQRQYQFRLDVDVCKARQEPLLKTRSKTIYEGKWILKPGPSIVLIAIHGATKAKCEASFYVKLSCHPHIVRTYGLVDSDSPENIMLVQEYAPEGDLSKLLRNDNFQPTFEVLLEIFLQIVDAMICLANNEIVHGDLACRNVLVFRSSPNQPAEMLVKLTDFGLTRESPLFSVFNAAASDTSVIIPIRHAAPEILYDTSSNHYSEKSDVYSFGVLMWEVCSGGAVPYGELKTSSTVYHERLKGKLLEQPYACPYELWNIILNCTKQESQQRPNFKAIREDLLTLKFQNCQDSLNRTHQIQADATYQNVTTGVVLRENIQRKTNHVYYNSEPFRDDERNKKPTEVSFYQNVNYSTNENRFSQSNDLNQASCLYFIPCEYCLESINADEFDKHKKVCKIRRLIKSFVKTAVKLPPLEITSCSNCENMIPLNMFYIHKNTCDGSSNFLDNTSPISTHKTLVDSYPTMNYLKPTPLPNNPLTENIYQNVTVANMRRSSQTRIDNRLSEISDESFTELESETITSTKPPKTGLRKTLSKLKRKILP